VSATARGAAAVVGLALGAWPVAAQHLTLGGTLSFAEHRVDAGFGLERTAGMIGGAVVGGRFGTLDVQAHARSGRLLLRSPTGTALDVAELGVGASWWWRPWIALRGAALARGYSADVGRQRWRMAELGAELRVPFAAGRVHGTVRGGWRPAVTVSGLSRPNTAFVAAAGTEYAVNRWSLAILYELERYDFPPQGGMRRFEQLSALTVQASVHPGR
jgi:hypothetical protein